MLLYQDYMIERAKLDAAVRARYDTRGEGVLDEGMVLAMMARAPPRPRTCAPANGDYNCLQSIAHRFHPVPLAIAALCLPGGLRRRVRAFCILHLHLHLHVRCTLGGAFGAFGGGCCSDPGCPRHPAGWV